jgi:tRNA(Ile)-lysidine synthase
LEYDVPVPGEVMAVGFGLHLVLSVTTEAGDAKVVPAKLRAHRAGDRVRLRYSQGLKRIKEVLERMQIPANQRPQWPVLEWQGEVVWMRGAELESRAGAVAGLNVKAVDLEI